MLKLLYSKARIYFLILNIKGTAKIITSIIPAHCGAVLAKIPALSIVLSLTSKEIDTCPKVPVLKKLEKLHNLIL